MIALLTLGCQHQESVVVDTVTVERPIEQRTQERASLHEQLPDAAGSIQGIVQTGTATFIGTTGGLFALTSSGLTRMDAGPVVALTVFNDTMLVAHSDRLLVWHEGRLVESPLSETLSGGDLTGLMARGDALWLSTTTGLFQYEGDEISSLMDAVDARGIHGGLSASYVTSAIGAEQNTLALEPGEDDWQVLDFSESQVVSIRPGDRSLFGLLEGDVYHYLTTPDGTVWRRVVTDEDSEASDPINLLETSAKGQLWGMSDAFIFRYSEGILTRIPRTDDMEANTLQVDMSGTAWLSDTSTLTAYFETQPATLEVSWTGSVNAFAEANCTRCHGALGTARPLHTQAQWASNIDSIIRVIEDGEMPADNQTLVLGDAELLRAWKDGDLR